MSTKSAATRIPPGPGLPVLRKNGARLLALDGGGVKGVSAVLILDAIMQKVKQIEIEKGTSTCQAPRKPCDYFDLAGGTSTGGLIALMLFRLRMDTQQCLQMYEQMAEQIFAPTLLGSRLLGRWFRLPALMLNTLFKGSEYSGAPLEKAIQQVVDQYSEQYDEWKNYLVNPKAGMMLMCATLKDKGESVLLRSYIRPEDAKPITGALRDDDDLMDSIKIVTAARATSAAPVYLPEKKWVASGQTITFWDGGVLNNNPVEQLWNSRYDLVDVRAPPPNVSCVLSLGCGWNANGRPGFVTRVLNTMTRYVESFMANTEAKHRDFQRLVQRMNDRGPVRNEPNVHYYRLNCPCGDVKFDMADFRIMPKLEDMTRKYIETDANAMRDIEACAELLASSE